MLVLLGDPRPHQGAGVLQSAQMGTDFACTQETESGQGTLTCTRGDPPPPAGPCSWQTPPGTQSFWGTPSSPDNSFLSALRSPAPGEGSHHVRRTLSSPAKGLPVEELSTLPTDSAVGPLWVHWLLEGGPPSPG